MNINVARKDVVQVLAILTIFGSAITWALNVGERLSSLEASADVRQRVDNLEEALLPILERAHLEELLRQRGLDIDGNPLSEKDKKDEGIRLPSWLESLSSNKTPMTSVGSPYEPNEEISVPMATPTSTPTSTPTPIPTPTVTPTPTPTPDPFDGKSKDEIIKALEEESKDWAQQKLQYKMAD